jgi:hypothetical protein
MTAFVFMVGIRRSWTAANNNEMVFGIFALLILLSLPNNSRRNPHNPNPKVAVRWGDQTDEEMMVGFF